MNELLKRSITGILYIAVIVSTAFFNHYAFIAFFALVGLVCLQELQELLDFRNYLSYFVLIVLLFLFNFIEYNQAIVTAMMAMTLIVKFFLLKDLYTSSTINLFTSKKHLITLFYLVPSIIFITLIPVFNGDYQPHILIGMFIMIWSNDSFAYLIGKSIGKHKLFESISPKKTIEGFVGGLVFSIISAFVLEYYFGILSIPVWVAMSIIVSIFGTLGDLVQSKFKRRADVKDSGTIMPGHGGIFDRMDSMLFSSTFVYLFLIIVDYVS
ncbi:MAG: phosphatidate cytidylyltransferase [Psychroflexus sp.]|nr:phosphatidate cytidylyltransferase [Psychroflexus sp.]MDN6309475.1 phosphatidate cytidylyltransferase [Psychroflexus sp.]